MRKAALAVSAAVFLGWIGWLAYAAWTKERGPLLSRSLAAVASHPVVAELQEQAELPGRPASRARVLQPLSDHGPPADTLIEVPDLPLALGWQGPGPYLLLLVPAGKGAAEPAPLRFHLVQPPRSPGYEPSMALPRLYPWTETLRRQWEQRDRW